jgi:hypothetical protein
LKGRDALPKLAKQCAEEGEWKNLDEEEKEWLLRSLREKKQADKQEPKGVVHASNDIAGTLSCLDPEVCLYSLLGAWRVLMETKITGLVSRTGAHMWYAIVRSKTTNPFQPRTFVTPQITNAFNALFKMTPGEMALKVDAYITGGLAGVVRLTGKNASVKLRSEIRELVLSGLCELDFDRLATEITDLNTGDTLIKHKKCTNDNAPTAMSYTNYNGLVEKWGIELIGWTEPEIANPSTIQTALGLNRLVNALRRGDCYWAPLTQEAWDKKLEEAAKRLADGKGKKRKQRWSKGLTRKAAKSIANTGPSCHVDHESLLSDSNGGFGSDSD